MKIEVIKSLNDASKATGLAVVIDVFRAFTTEAFLFANGADKIIPVLDLEEAYKLKNADGTNNCLSYSDRDREVFFRIVNEN